MSEYLSLKSFKDKEARARYVADTMLVEGLKLLEEYTGNAKPMNCEILYGDYKGYKATITWNNFIQGKRPDFRGLRIEEKNRFIFNVFEPEGYRVASIPQDVKRKDKISVISPQGHEWSVAIDTFLKGTRCPLDSDRSWGERCVSTVLKANGVPFKAQKAIYHTDGSRQYLDFYIEYRGVKYNIEYNGRQHYQEERINRLFNSLEAQQESDKKKSSYCKDNQIIQIIIPYMVTDVKEIAMAINEHIPVVVKQYEVESYRYDEQAVMDYYKNHTLEETAKKFGISGSTIKNIKRRKNIKKKSNYCEAELLAYYEDHSAQETADKLGITKHTVYGVVRKYKNGGSLNDNNR